GGLIESLDDVEHVNRNTDGAPLVGDGPGDCLADPPVGVGGKSITAVIFEPLYCLHQSDVSFLNQVCELNSAVQITLGDRNYQPEVRFNQLFLVDLAFQFGLLYPTGDMPNLAGVHRQFGLNPSNFFPDRRQSFLDSG